MKKTNSISILGMIKLHGIVGFTIGIVLGILYGIGGFFVDLIVTLGWFETTATPGLSYGTVLALGALIGFPIIFLVVGLITGLVVALIYNFIPKKLRVKVDL